MAAVSGQPQGVSSQPEPMATGPNCQQVPQASVEKGVQKHTVAEEEDSLACDSGEHFRLLEPLRGVASDEICSWQPIEGASFLPGYAGGTPVAAGSLATAKAMWHAAT
eukprot:s1909_g9.t1